jgi:hypothetical protein
MNSHQALRDRDLQVENLNSEVTSARFEAEETIKELHNQVNVKYWYL